MGRMQSETGGLMTKKMTVLLALTMILTTGIARPVVLFAQQNEKIAPRQAFSLLKELAGEWRGRVMDGEQGPEVTVLYRVTANGSAVLETLFPGTSHEMLTVYFMDGEKLALTHYCAMGNQPRMVLDPGSTGRQLVFIFTGGSNLDPAQDIHMHSGRMTRTAVDCLEHERDTFGKGQKIDTKKFFLKRVK